MAIAMRVQPLSGERQMEANLRVPLLAILSIGVKGGIAMCHHDRIQPPGAGRPGAILDAAPCKA